MSAVEGPERTESSLPVLVLVMGVCGVGKSVVGKAVADRIAAPDAAPDAAGGVFVEGDSYHPQANRDKMARGQPLTDNDRRGWLAALRTAVAAALEGGNGGGVRPRVVVVACSALKASYRSAFEGLRASVLHTVHLACSKAELLRRVAARQEATGHFMPPSLVESQLEALQAPACGDAVTTISTDSADVDGCVAAGLTAIQTRYDVS
eukprot:Rhum_TRINITY_DN7702_c0_g1::Rhum_TRINITY_DN7702_c0_g1_i1::g.24287::m.24287/K00851/E2.7.1.12, gntK, idnK; gluconokinase